MQFNRFCPYDVLDFEEISLDATVKSLNTAKAKANHIVYIQVQSDSDTDTAARIYFHGANPSQTAGYKYKNGDTVMVEGSGNLCNIRVIRDTGASALNPKILVTYIKFS